MSIKADSHGCRTGLGGALASLAVAVAGLAYMCSAGSATDFRHAMPPVDVALVLAIDISRSISAEEHRLQMDGYARAFRDRAVVKAIGGGAHGVIAVSVLEWADIGAPHPNVEWMLIRDAASAEHFAAQIESLPYRPADGTAIGSAIGYAHVLLDRIPYAAERRVIDVSGDGVSMRPSHLAYTRARAIAAGITINGLPICESKPCEVQAHYAEQVVGGPGSFVVVADGFASFDRAILKKLVLEISSHASGQAKIAVCCEDAEHFLRSVQF